MSSGNPALLRREKRTGEKRRPQNTHRGRPSSSSRHRGNFPVPVSAALSSPTVRCLRRAREMLRVHSGLKEGVCSTRHTRHTAVIKLNKHQHTGPHPGIRCVDETDLQRSADSARTQLLSTSGPGSALEPHPPTWTLHTSRIHSLWYFSELALPFNSFLFSFFFSLKKSARKPTLTSNLSSCFSHPPMC